MSTSTMDRDFNKNFLISLGMHALIAILAVLGGKVISTVFKNDDVEIIRSAVRVDVVGMPKFTVQELKAMQKEAPRPKEPEVAVGKKEETKVETEDVIKKDDLVIQKESKKKNKASFLSLLNEASNKKVEAKEQKKGKADGKDNKNLEALVLEGNRLSSGTAIVGEYSDQSNSAIGIYGQTVLDNTRRFWKLPSYLKEMNLACQIRVYLSSSGSILKLDLHKSSGNSEYDAKAEKAVRDAAPFVKPDAELAPRLANSGLILAFPL